MRYWLVMPAAGSGQRFRGGSEPSAGRPSTQPRETPKQYAELAGRTVIEWALEPFATDSRCAGIVVALCAGDPHWPRISAPRSAQTVEGGAERAHSVRRGLAALAGRALPDDWVLVHDAARPCLAREDLDRLIAACEGHGVGGLLAAPVADTIKACEADGAVARTVDRTGLWRALTPQMFRYGALCAALDAAFTAGRSPTDEAQALEWTGARPIVVRGSARNLKITTAEDLTLAAAQLRNRSGEGAMQTGGAGEAGSARIGSGFDVHAFGPGEFVMLGGVRIPHTHGVVAHSDGDVILHALCDALLGAGGLGDIGQHFRDDDPRWRGADSSGFVRAVLGMLRERHLAVVNADVTLLAESPRVGAHRDAIRTSIARLLEVPVERVNVKATTTERLGFLGRREGIAAQAVVLLASAGTGGGAR
jgi:2-C-methyl-D-erythritol 4-phosphate cytidylyltransferase / 2-C-methyl-D-erythritol 2,4-cyclodiphosphate synthase